MESLDFVVLGFACFRLTHLIVADDITSFLRAPFVDEVVEPDAEGRMNKMQYPKMPKWRGYVGALIACPWCMGVWVGGFLVTGWYLAPEVVFFLSAILAVSGLGISLETATKYWSVNSMSPTASQAERVSEVRTLLLGADARDGYNSRGVRVHGSSDTR